MFFFFNRRKSAPRQEKAERLHQGNITEIDRDTGDIHTVEEKENALRKTREALADANDNLLAAASDVEREQAEGRITELMTREREIIARGERSLGRYERQLQRIHQELKAEQEIQDTQEQVVQGVKETVESLLVRMNELEKRRTDAIAEQRAQEVTRKELQIVESEILQQASRLTDLKREDEELVRELVQLKIGGLIARFRRSKKKLLSERESARRKIKEVSELLRQLQCQKSQVQRASESRAIRLECELQDAAAAEKPESEVLEIQRELLKTRKLLADFEAVEKELVLTENRLTGARTNLTIIEIRIEIAALPAKGDSTKTSDPETIRRVATVQEKIVSVPWELERKLVGLELAAKIGLPDSARKTATWEEKEPTSPWCPEEVKPHLSFAADFQYQNDYSCEEDSLPGWKIIAATRRGRMHAHHGTYREDAFSAVPGENFVIACVSDGAGAHKYSRIGSETTCRQVTERLKTRIEGAKGEFAILDDRRTAKKFTEMVTLSVSESCEFLRNLAGKAGCQQKDFRCTLIVAMLYKIQTFEWIGFCQVGDGFIAGVNDQGVARRYAASDSGAFSGEVGCFIPDDSAPSKAADSVGVIEASDLESLILCSDGVEDPFYPVGKNAARIFRQLYQGVRAPLGDFVVQPAHGPIIGAAKAKEHLGKWLSFVKKGENDDRTMLVLHRNPSSFNSSKIVVE